MKAKAAMLMQEMYAFSRRASERAPHGVVDYIRGSGEFFGHRMSKKVWKKPKNAFSSKSTRGWATL